MSGMMKPVDDFLKDRFNLGLVTALIFLGSFVIFSGSGASPDMEYNESENLTVSFFYLPTCPHCKEERPLVEEIEAEMPDIRFNYYDASTSEGYNLYKTLATASGYDNPRMPVPAIFFGKELPLVGGHSKEEIKTFIEGCKEKCESIGSSDKTQGIETVLEDVDIPFIGTVSVKELGNYSLPALAAVLGLIDGFNPCAMWVLVYLMALIMEINDRKKIWMIVGSFVMASGVLYFLFMTAWINFFLLIGYVRILTIAIGLFALGAGILSLRDYMKTKGEALKCKIGDEKLHGKTMGRIQRIISEPLSAATIASIIVLAFVVNSVEFACSSMIPMAFTQILALKGLPALTNYLYIGLYTFFFMLDDLIIFGMAAFAVSSSYGEKYAKYCKAIAGVLLVVLGILMLFFPGLLR